MTQKNIVITLKIDWNGISYTFTYQTIIEGRTGLIRYQRMYEKAQKAFTDDYPASAANASVLFYIELTDN